jgi:hypothetical protein
MNLFRRLVARSRDDAGAAMVTTLLVAAVMTGLGVVAIDVSLSNLKNAGRDRVAGIALDTSESGVAQALEYLRGAGTNELSCSPTCATNAWGNKTSPQVVTLPNGRQYNVWIEVVQAFKPPVYKTATYKIHSLGTAGTGPGSRTVEVTVEAKPFDFPVGIYADTFEDAGNGSVHTEQMFAKNCIVNRDAITFGGSTDPMTGAVTYVDPFYGYPPAAHSADYITEANQLSQCSAATSIHAVNKCNPMFPGDQDKAGGQVTAFPTCAGVVMGNDPKSSLFTATDLSTTYGNEARGLTAAQYAALKSKAIAQGNYWDESTLGSFVAPCVALCPAGKTPTPNGVLYFKVNSTTTIGNQFNDITEFKRSHCGLRSLVIVIEGGNATLNNTVSLTAALFVPDGSVKYNGGAVLDGTLFARQVNKFNGTADFYLDPCFVANFPGGLFDITPTRFREVDR